MLKVAVTAINSKAQQTTTCIFVNETGNPQVAGLKKKLLLQSSEPLHKYSFFLY